MKTPWEAFQERLRALGATDQGTYSIISVEYVPTHPVPPWPLSPQEETRVLAHVRESFQTQENSDE